MDFYFIIWCFLFVLAVLFELLSPGLFFFLSFALGFAVAALLNFFELSFSDQLQAFAIISLISCFLLKMVAAKFLKGTWHPTNVDALIGKKGVVIESIAIDNKGYVKVNGEIWLAKSAHNEFIEKDLAIEVVAVKGIHLIVKKI